MAGSVDSLGTAVDGFISPPAMLWSRATPTLSAVVSGDGDMACSEVLDDCSWTDPSSLEECGGGDAEGISGFGSFRIGGVGDQCSLPSATQGGVCGTSSALTGAGDNGDRDDARSGSTSIAAAADVSPTDPVLRARSTPGVAPGSDIDVESGGP